MLQLCTQEDVASFIASLNVFPHAAENVYKLCKPYEGDPRCQKEQLCFDISIHFCGCTDSKPLTSWPYFGVKLRKKIAYSYLKVTYCYPNVNYSGLKVTYS